MFYPHIHWCVWLEAQTSVTIVGWIAEFYINSNADTSDSDLSLLTKANFSHYKIHSTLLPSPIAHTPGPTRSPSMAISGISDCQVALLNFKKGTNRDLSAYLTFKSEKYYDTFCHSFHAPARAQGLGNILDSNFCPKPSDTSAQLLFSEQEFFMYSVLVVTLQTERGKELTKD